MISEKKNYNSSSPLDTSGSYCAYLRKSRD